MLSGGCPAALSFADVKAARVLKGDADRPSAPAAADALSMNHTRLATVRLTAAVFEPKALAIV